MLNLTKHQKGKRAYFPTKGVYLYRGRTSNQNMGRTYFGRTSESQVYKYIYACVRIRFCSCACDQISLSSLSLAFASSHSSLYEQLANIKSWSVRPAWPWDPTIFI